MKTSIKEDWKNKRLEIPPARYIARAIDIEAIRTTIRVNRIITLVEVVFGLTIIATLFYVYYSLFL